jgi:hypothetical protein
VASDAVTAELLAMVADNPADGAVKFAVTIAAQTIALDRTTLTANPALTVEDDTIAHERATLPV